MAAAEKAAAEDAAVEEAAAGEATVEEAAVDGRGITIEELAKWADKVAEGQNAAAGQKAAV